MRLQFYRRPGFQDVDTTMLGSTLWAALVIAFILCLVGYLTLEAVGLVR